MNFKADGEVKGFIWLLNGIQKYTDFEKSPAHGSPSNPHQGLSV